MISKNQMENERHFIENTRGVSKRYSGIKNLNRSENKKEMVLLLEE